MVSLIKPWKHHHHLPADLRGSENPLYTTIGWMNTTEINGATLANTQFLYFKVDVTPDIFIERIQLKNTKNTNDW